MKEKEPRKDKDKERRVPSAEKPAENYQPVRRNLLVSALAIIIGGIVGLVPAAAGLMVFLDPLRRKGRKGEFIPVARLDQVPPDGIPRPFQVVVDVTDAWNFYPNEPIGAVYLRRIAADAPLEAVTATCPHLGCFVDFDANAGSYKCPCHDSQFEVDGKRIDPDHCPSARDLDTLQVKVEEGPEGQIVLVEYQKFKSSSARKVAEE